MSSCRAAEKAIESTPNSSSEAVSEQEVFERERASISSHRGRPQDGKWMGLALSGGGIRSATFCLGALQRFARGEVLQHFDYMSSVSGGGYTAASVQWWWARNPSYDAGKRFPYGIDPASSTDNENPNLAFLRWHSSYLAPGGGISVWSGIAVVFRTLLISMFVWFPTAVAVLLIIIAAPAFVVGALRATDAPIHAGWDNLASNVDIALPLFDTTVPLFAAGAMIGIVAIALLFLAATTVLAVTSVLIPPETTDNKRQRVTRAVQCAVIGLIFGVVGAFWAYNLLDYGKLDPTSASILVIGVVLLALGVLAVIVAFLQGFDFLEFGVNYGFRRAFDLYATYLFAVLAPLLIFASLPFVSDAITHYIVQHAGKKGVVLAFFTAASGVLSGLYGHLVQAQRLAPKYATRWAATLAAVVFLYGMTLISYLAANSLIKPPEFLSALSEERWRVAFFAVLFFSLLFGASSNLNYLGLHRFYRDRLMEAFLPSDLRQAAEAPKYTDADRAPIADFWVSPKPMAAKRPYPLFNTNAILIHDSDPTNALRGGTSFLLSPLFIGSSATKWVDTKSHGERHGALTLASAMAASGASANANAAYIGSGITRDRLISIVMMLLNVRLGIWLAAPGVKSGIPNYFSPGLNYGVLRKGYRADSSFMELTDGGHFDNLGVYELVRRRADLIVTLDSEEDPSTSMSALASVCQRVLEDFNVFIDVGDKADKIAPTGDMGYPSQAKFTARSYFITKIHYNQPKINLPGDETAKIGYFVYIKSNMIKGLGFPSKGYKAKNPDFPNQPTMDQFFEPAQFEAYRELGFSTVDAFISDLKVDHVDAATLLAKVAAAA